MEIIPIVRKTNVCVCVCVCHNVNMDEVNFHSLVFRINLFSVNDMQFVFQPIGDILIFVRYYDYI